MGHYGLLIIAALTALLALLWMLSGSLQSLTDVLSNDTFLPADRQGVFILITSSIPMSTLIMRSFFVSQPRDLEEAASLDGAGPLSCSTTMR